MSLLKLLIICFVCFNHHETSIVTATTLNLESLSLDQFTGRGHIDTLRFEVRISTKQTSINDERLGKPPSVRFSSKTAIDGTQIITYPVGKPKIFPLPRKLRIFTPGQDEISMPEKVRAYGKVVPKKYPTTTFASMAGIDANAIGDIQHMDVDQGMNSSFINAILKDERGHLWFGTNGAGVCRYDGKNLECFAVEHGLSSHYIASILEDKQGNLWFGTKGAGVNRYDGHSFTQFRFDNGNGGGYVESMVQDNKGNIWFGLRRGGGVSVYDGNSFVNYTEAEGLIANEITSLLEDRYGSVWIGTRKGICKFDGVSFTHYPPSIGSGIEKVQSMLEDSEGHLWFGTIGDGVFRFDGSNFYQYTIGEGLSDNQIQAIEEDLDGHLWFGTRSRGAIQYDGDRFTHYTKEQGLCNDRIQCMTEDGQGDLWFGTWGVGAIRYRPNSFKHYRIKKSSNENQVLSILEDRKGNLWIGSNKGVRRFDGVGFEQYGSDLALSNLPILCLMEDRNGNVWFGTDHGGAYRYDGDRLTLFGTDVGLENSSVQVMLEDHRGHLWFGTRHGLFQYDGDHFTLFGSEEKWAIGSMIEDKTGRLWISTSSQGIIQYDGTDFTSITARYGLENIDVTVLFDDNNGNIWIGTRYNGLMRFDGTNFSEYDVADGLSHNEVKAIAEDKDKNIWISTQKGITALQPLSARSSSLDQSEVRDYQLFTFGKADGLKRWDYLERSACSDNKNRIWWGSFAGLTMLDLATFNFPQKSPAIKMNSLEVLQTHVDYRRIEDSTYQTSLTFAEKLIGTHDSILPFYNYPQSIALPHHLSTLTFNFFGVDWVAPHKLRYSFFMEGVDNSWSPPSFENAAVYQNLAPGLYKLRVRGIGAAQIWSSPIEYAFSIYPPWWKAWWAYILYGILAFVGLWRLHRYEINRQRILHRLDVENLRVNELEQMSQMKSNFFTHISHEFRTPLTLILGPIKELIETFPKSNLNYLQLVQRSSYKLLTLINQLLDLSKIDANGTKLQASYLDLVPVTRQLFALFTSRAEALDIKYSFHANTDALYGFFDQDKLEKMLVNLLGNAFKYTDKQGHIRLDVRAEKETAIITVSDSGLGISGEDLPHIFDRFFQSGSDSRKQAGSGIGLALVKELVQLHHGTISVKSERKDGTQFSLHLPLGSDHLSENEIIDHKSSSRSVDVTLIASQPASADLLQPPTNLEDKPIVLIVDDHSDMRAYIRQILEQNFRTVEVADGQQALKYSREEVPDFILSDVMMPGMNGKELCRKLKTDPSTSHIPVILLTARDDLESRIKGLESGADAYLAKPFDKSELMVRLQKLIELRTRLQAHYQSLSLFESDHNAGVQTESNFIRQLQKHIEDNLDNDQVGIVQICRKMSMSRAQIYRKVKALTGESVGHFIRRIRLRKAQDLLKNSCLNVSEIAYEVGFKDPAYFSRIFREEFGMSPRKARQNI